MDEARVALLSRRQGLSETVRVALSFAGLRFVSVPELEALERELSAEDPASAVLVDLADRDEDASAIARAVRATKPGSNAPLFFLGSGSEPVSSTQSAIAAGGDAYFALPAEAAPVIARLATYLSVPLARVPASLQLDALAADPSDAPEDANEGGDGGDANAGDANADDASAGGRDADDLDADDEGTPPLVGLAPPLSEEPQVTLRDDDGRELAADDPHPAWGDLDDDDDGAAPEVTAEMDAATFARLTAKLTPTDEGPRADEGAPLGAEPPAERSLDGGSGREDIASRVQRLRSRVAEGRRDTELPGASGDGGGWSLPGPLGSEEGAALDDDTRSAPRDEHGFEAITERITDEDLNSALAEVRERDGLVEYPPLEAMPSLVEGDASASAPAPEGEALEAEERAFEPPPLDADDAAGDAEDTVSGFLAPPPTFAEELQQRDDEREAEVADEWDEVDAALAPPVLHFPDAEAGLAPLLDELGLVPPPDEEEVGGTDSDRAPDVAQLERDYVYGDDDDNGDGEGEPPAPPAEVAAGAGALTSQGAAALLDPSEALVQARLEDARRELELELRLAAEARLERELEERVERAVAEAREQAEEERQRLERELAAASERERLEAEAAARAAAEQHLLDVERRLKAEEEAARLAMRRDLEEAARAEADARVRELEQRQRDEEARLREELEERLAAAEKSAREQAEEEALRIAEELALAQDAARERAEAEARQEAQERVAEAERTRAEAEERARRELEELRQSAAVAREQLEQRLRQEADERIAELERRAAEAEAHRHSEEQRREEIEAARRQQAEEEARLRAELEAELRRELEERVAAAEQHANEVAARERERIEAGLREEGERLAQEAAAAARREVEQRLSLEAAELAEQAADEARAEAEARAHEEAEQLAQVAAAEARREAEERLSAEAARRAEEAAAAARREAEERFTAEAARRAQQAEKARREAEERLVAEAERKVREAWEARREAEERLVAEAARTARQAEEARREAEERLRQEADARQLELEARLQAAEEAARLAEERTRQIIEEERLAREEAEATLKAREEELARHRSRWAFRTGAALSAAEGEHDGPGESELGVGRISWWGADAPGVPVDALTFEPGGELGVEPPPAPERWVYLDPPEGTFSDGELPALLWGAHVLCVTGALVLIDRAGLRRTLHLEHGEPVGFLSDLSRDRPEEALLRAGLITAAKHTELRAGPLRSARRTCAYLVDEGGLKPQELFTAIRGVLIEQVLSVLELSSGRFEFLPEAAHASDRVRLQHRFDAVLAEGIRRKYDLRRLWRVLGGAQTLVGKDDRAPRLPPLTKVEHAALALLDGQRSLEDAVLDGALPAEDVLRAALIGVSCGAARIIARGVPGAPEEVAKDSERALAIDKERIEDRVHAARHGDYFSFLGIAPESTSFEVHRAAEQVRRQFDPRRYSDPAFRDLRAALDEIRQVADEAEAVLSDDALRAGYVRSVVSRRMAGTRGQA